MNVLWYYASGGRTFGPFSWAELRDAARAGGFGPADHVWTPGYGAEWKRASELGTLFPPPKGDADAPGASNAAGAPNGALSGDARASETPSPEIRRRRPPRLPVEERSPFRTPEPDGRTPAPPRVLLSLRNAWSNLLTILLDRFSLRRALVFCLCALLLFLGAQSEIPTVSDDPAARSRLEEAGPGLAALANLREDILRRAALLQEEAGGLDGRPDAVRAAAGAALRGLGGAMREQCAAILNWTRTSSLSQRLSVFGVSALLLAAL